MLEKAVYFCHFDLNLTQCFPITRRLFQKYVLKPPSWRRFGHSVFTSTDFHQGLEGPPFQQKKHHRFRWLPLEWSSILEGAANWEQGNDLWVGLTKLRAVLIFFLTWTWIIWGIGKWGSFLHQMSLFVMNVFSWEVLDITFFLLNRIVIFFNGGHESRKAYVCVCGNLWNFDEFWEQGGPPYQS